MKLLVSLAIATPMLAASLSTQSAPCLAFNDANTSVPQGAVTRSPAPGQNPRRYAYQFAPQATLAVQAASICTASPPPPPDDYMRLEIWDEDPATGLPGNLLAGGAFLSPNSSAAQWLGTNLDRVALLNAGTNYWFVWVEPGSSSIPHEPGSLIALPRAGRLGSGPWSQLSPAAVKFRLYCNPLDAAGVTPAGSPTLTAIGQIPGAFVNDEPLAGQSIGIEATNLPPGASAWLLLGLDRNHVSQSFGGLFPPGFMVHTDSVITVSGMTGTAKIGDPPSSPRPAPSGFVRWELSIPLGATNVFLGAQALAIDSGHTAFFPLVGTNAIRVVTR